MIGADLDYRAKIRSLKVRRVNDKKCIAVSTFSNQGYFIEEENGNKNLIKSNDNFNIVFH